LYGRRELPRPETTRIIARTDLNCEERELPIDELTIEELDSVNGGRIKLPINDFVKAWKIAQLERDCPGFV